MNILMVSTPATGHINPLLGVARVLISEGHNVVCLSGSALRDRIESAGAGFRALPPAADLDLNDLFATVPELKVIPPGLEWLRVATERLFIERIVPQHEGIQQVLQEFPADVIIGDDMMFGLLPMLLGPRANRLPVVLCGTSFLHWCRDDGAPHFLGLPPATTDAERTRYAAIAEEYSRTVDQPAALRLNNALAALGVGPLSASLSMFESVVAFADAYMQLTVPGFEFPRPIPSAVRFIGTLPILPNQAPLPPWAHELDGTRKVVLVTQGTVANHNFDLLIAPTLAALASEPDVLVIATAGGRPVEAIPGPIPANARLASFLPFEWLLPKVDVLVTNGGYGSVNQALSCGIPLVTAGQTEDKADVNARVAWSGVGIDLATNEPTPPTLREAVRTVLDSRQFRACARSMAEAFRNIDTKSEILRIVEQAVWADGNGRMSAPDTADAERAHLKLPLGRLARPAASSPVPIH
jgi:UDP:flavonoid glycosyltransferase YjiC (YdhE family)